MWRIVAAFGGYLLGSIPVAWIVTYVAKRQDLRNLGSGNVGVTNAAIQVARWAGLLVFLCELGKGALAALVPRWLGADTVTAYISVCGAILGTRWPIWLRLRGGRGNSAGIGALCVLSWPAVPMLGGIWLALRLATKSPFIATRGLLVSLPVVIALLARSWLAGGVGLLISLVYLSTHDQGTDDHLLIKGRWSSLIAFLTMPPRK